MRRHVEQGTIKRGPRIEHFMAECCVRYVQWLLRVSLAKSQLPVATTYSPWQDLQKRRRRRSRF
jgi:hypothetical protein